VQKYEKGENRLGAGRLTKIAAVLDVPVSELLSDDSAGQSNRRGVDEAHAPLKLLTAAGALRLLKAYARSMTEISGARSSHWSSTLPRARASPSRLLPRHSIKASSRANYLHPRGSRAAGCPGAHLEEYRPLPCFGYRRKETAANPGFWIEKRADRILEHLQQIYSIHPFVGVFDTMW
jgi:transcriptional regulator with XRE-family HTH domain